MKPTQHHLPEPTQRRVEPDLSPVRGLLIGLAAGMVCYLLMLGFWLLL